MLYDMLLNIKTNKYMIIKEWMKKKKKKGKDEYLCTAVPWKVGMLEYA